jgi:DNA helicase-2/ATP-dependent DNA helicase PcrA
MRCRTFDSFSLELVTPYAASLGLPAPLRVGPRGNATFIEVSRAARQLLERSPAIARAMGQHFPMIIADEHQDTRIEHHHLCLLLQRAGGSCLRLFCDPMQAVFGFDEAELVEVDDLQATAQVVVLDVPRRWPHVPELGAWLSEARAALERGGRLPLATAPPSVTAIHLDSPQPRGRQIPPPVLASLRRTLRRIPAGDTVAVLAWRNEDVEGAQRLEREQLVMNEGAAVDIARNTLISVVEASGSAQRMACIGVDLIGAVSVGCTAAVRSQLVACLEPQRVAMGRRQRFGPIAEAFAPLYAQPDVVTFGRCLVQACAAAEATGAITIHRAEAVAVLGALALTPEQDPVDAYEEMVRARPSDAARRGRLASTIHRSKGCEYDHVVLTHAGSTGFPDNRLSRRLLYTALSRAKRSITILIPDRDPSPLLRP